MKIKAIGKYGRYAPYGEATNCYLLQTKNGKNILIDLGAGSLAKLQNEIKIEQIDCVIITHLHFDHASDLGVLSYALGYLGLKKLKVFLPQTPEIAFKMYSLSNFETQIINENLTFEIDGLQFSFKKSPHPVETYSVIIKENSSTLVYTSDCSSKEVLTQNTLGANYVIGDACVLDGNWTENAPHISVKQLAESVPSDAQLFLAHLSCGDENNILSEAKLYNKNAKLICDFEINK